MKLLRLLNSSWLFTALSFLSVSPTVGQDFMFGSTKADNQLNQKSSVQLVSGKSYDSSQARFYQRFIDQIPLHGARVVAESDGDDFLIPGLDQFEDPSTFDATYPAISMDLAVKVAEANVDFPTASDVKMVWFQTNTHAKLCWEVVTTLTDLGEPVSPTHMEAIVDGQTGDLLSQRQIDTNDYSPSDFRQTEWGIFPRIVVNDAMGISGGRAYGAPFDAVAYVGGCTGTLIAPNIVLCARHCGAGPGTQVIFGSNLNGGGLVFRSVQSSFLPDGNGSLLDGGDVSILTLNASVPTSVAVPMRLIDETNDLEGMLCATVGYGLNGLGSSGHNFTSDNYRWGGENIIDRYGSPASQGGSNIISTDFDNGSNSANSIGGSSPSPVEFEATTAPGDSGGPVLVQLEGEWVIAGVLSGGTSSTSTYGDISWWTGTAIYRDEIESRGGEFGVPAPGACCFANGSCALLFNSECDSSGGVFEGASTSCAPSPCPPPTMGACCFGTVCSELTPTGCETAGGSFGSLGSDCSSDPCAPRACCLDSGDCILVSADDCLIAGGSTDAVDCASSSCAPPTIGACCFGSTCSELTPTGCETGGGVFNGLGTSCADNVCAPRACCLTTGDCVVLVPDTCSAVGGTSDAADCASSSCAPPACPEDLNDNGSVDFADLLEVLGSWGTCGGCDEDFDGNGVVEFNDLLNLLSKWGAC